MSYVYNNLYLNNVAAEQIYLEPCFSQSGGTVYAYDNTVIPVSGATNIEIDPEGGSGACANTYLYNNTLYQAGSAAAIRAVQNHSGTNNVNILTLTGNFLITDYGGSSIDSSGVTTFTNITTVQIGTSTATSQGYLAAVYYAPGNGSGSSVGAGTNLTSSCGSVGSALCSATTAGGLIAAIPRGATWDAGSNLWVSPPPTTNASVSGNGGVTGSGVIH